jgi:ferredoxin
LVLLLLPIDQLFLKKPLSSSIRYGFHVLIIILPIFVYGHIALWEASRFGWHWPALPDRVADITTLAVVLVAGFYLLRRIASKEARGKATAQNYCLILITAVPFLTGFLITEGSEVFDPHATPGNLVLVHVVSAEIMLVMVAFLFSVIAYDKQKCTSCGACALRCPVNAIALRDLANTRHLSYCHKLCVHCEACVDVCPEDAVGLRHVISPRLLLDSRFVEKTLAGLMPCRKCGSPFMPTPQVERVRQLIDHEYVYLCSACKKNFHGSALIPGGVAGRSMN